MNERSRTTAASASRLLPSPRTSRGFDAGGATTPWAKQVAISASPACLALPVSGIWSHANAVSGEYLREPKAGVGPAVTRDMRVANLRARRLTDRCS